MDSITHFYVDIRKITAKSVGLVIYAGKKFSIIIECNELRSHNNCVVFHCFFSHFAASIVPQISIIRNKNSPDCR